MDFTESDEHAMLRAAAGDVAAGFGHEWFRERARAGGRAEELWRAMAAPGFLSVHLPERYGGGGGGMSELVVVSDGFDAADNWIAERAGLGDIVVTADIPLADRALKAGATVRS